MRFQLVLQGQTEFLVTTYFFFDILTPNLTTEYAASENSTEHLSGKKLRNEVKARSKEGRKSVPYVHTTQLGLQAHGMDRPDS